jgi:CubicO group peptidase (beta-lactamase class C family)
MMPMLTLDPARWQAALDLAARWAGEGKVPAITLATGTRERLYGPVSFGSLTVDEQQPLPAVPIYLVASITKPIVALAALKLVEQGRITLGDRITDYIPSFGKNGKNGVEIRHLLTHTSGLPDMVPNNVALRQANAPLAKFLEEICTLPLAFPPGRAVQYQSTGLLVLSEIVHQVTGELCSQFLEREVFQPLGMHDTALGAPDEWFHSNAERRTPTTERIPEVRLEPEQAAGAHWNWNSRYWRQLGAPWGGLLTTADDMAKLSQCLLRNGRTTAGCLLFAPASIAAATTNQLTCLRELPEDERRCRPWGLGWRLNWPAHSANFGDLLGPHTYGHWGATGTLMWIDPERGTFTIILTTQPQEPTGFFLSRLSNAIAAVWG